MFSIFGQELHLRETMMAVQVVAEAPEDAWHPAITACLPQKSETTRARLADKLLQRLCAGDDDPLPLARVLARVADTQVRREMVYLAAARTEGLVSALARDLLYPVLVECGPPHGVGRDEFAVRNTGQLVPLEPSVTLSFAAWYAERRWQFGRARTVALALRIMRQAGLLISGTPRGLARRELAYSLLPHGISEPAFALAVHLENEGRPVPVEGIERAGFAQDLLVPPAAVAAALRAAERAGLLRVTSAGGGRRVAQPVSLATLEQRLAASEV